MSRNNWRAHAFDRGFALQGSLYLPEGHRLTTETGVSVSTADRTAQGTIYSTPHPGAPHPQGITLSDGVRCRAYESGEISLAISATSGKVYDVFRGWSGGGPALLLSSAWTNNTTRADALGTLLGKPVLASDKTFLHVATFRASNTNAVADTKQDRLISNVYNRVLRGLYFLEATSHTYNGAAWQYWNGSSANVMGIVNCVPQIIIAGMTALLVSQVGTTGLGVSLGLDGAVPYPNSTNAEIVVFWSQPVGSLIAVANGTFHMADLTAGYHAITLLEYGGGTTPTFSYITGHGRSEC